MNIDLYQFNKRYVLSIYGSCNINGSDDCFCFCFCFYISIA
ncbi:hypothetical protein PPBDW_I21793 [Photobacterium kishitanii]|nr:hypothetical protein PPBDW_I21793 [Photobacterium kishitanii]